MLHGPQLHTEKFIENIHHRYDGSVHLSEVSMHHQGVFVVLLPGSFPIHCRITVISFMHWFSLSQTFGLET